METLQRTANRGSLATGYDIDNSVKLEADNSEYFSRTPSSNTNRQTFTYSTWVKRTELGQNARLIDAHQDGQNFFTFGFDTSDRLVLYNIDSGVDYGGHYTRKFRDTSAWYHIVFKSDTTNGTAANRWQIYANGVEVTGKDTDYGTPPQNYNSNLNSTISTKVGYNTDGSNGSSQYMAETHLVDGTALAPTAFGEFDEDTGIWKPIEVDVTYGTNGFYLNYENASVLGDDDSGNGNNFTANNITSADQATDTPTNNFAIGNILTGTGGYFVITEGATKAVLSTAGPGNNIGGVSLVSTLAPSSGKWYFEAQNTNSGDVYLYLGVSDTGSIAYTDGKVFGGSGSNPSVGWRGGGAQDGKVYINNSATGTADTWETEVVGVALDLDNGKIYFHKSGTYINSGDPASGTDNGGQYDLPTAVDGQWYLGFSAYNLATWLINFGGYTSMTISSAASDANGYGTFEYAPPSGYYALCTKNLAEYG